MEWKKLHTKSCLLSKDITNLWYCDTVVLCTLALWYCSTVVPWYCGTAVLWYYGAVVLWYGGTVVLWYRGTAVLGCYDFYGTVVLTL